MKTLNSNWKRILIACSIACVCGCNQQGLHSLEGKLAYEGGNAFVFSGDTLELRSQADQSKRAFGEIKSDGTFKIDSLNDGKFANGTIPGSYDARIVISDDDYEHKKLAAKSINKKYLNFETSGLKVNVPATGLTLSISK